MSTFKDKRDAMRNRATEDHREMERAWFGKERKIGSVKLWPLTAARKQALIELDNLILKYWRGELEKPLTGAELEKSGGEFIFVLAATPEEICATVNDKANFKASVLTFLDSFSIPELNAAIAEIPDILKESLIGKDYQVESKGRPPPNEQAPAGSLAT